MLHRRYFVDLTSAAWVAFKSASVCGPSEYPAHLARRISGEFCGIVRSMPSLADFWLYAVGNAPILELPMSAKASFYGVINDRAVAA